MGCFDVIRFRCPKCSELIKVQSKGGRCEAKSFSPANVPLGSASYIHNKTKHTQHSKEKWQIQGPKTVQLSLGISEVAVEEVEVHCPLLKEVKEVSSSEPPKDFTVILEAQLKLPRFDLPSTMTRNQLISYIGHPEVDQALLTRAIDDCRQ